MPAANGKDRDYPNWTRAGPRGYDSHHRRVDETTTTAHTFGRQHPIPDVSPAIRFKDAQHLRISAVLSVWTSVLSTRHLVSTSVPAAPTVLAFYNHAGLLKNRPTGEEHNHTTPRTSFFSVDQDQLHCPYPRPTQSQNFCHPPSLNILPDHHTVPKVMSPPAPQVKTRISYILPPTPAENVPRLKLPPPGAVPVGMTGPLVVPYYEDGNEQNGRRTVPGLGGHPRHRLGVAALALDTTTVLEGRSNPGGILYTGGRDGLVISWDLGLEMKEKVQEEEERTNWETMTGWDDDEDDDASGGDGDVLGDVVENLKANSRTKQGEWSMDSERFRVGETPTSFRQCAEMHSDWVNDILLCNFNQTIISASSDGTVKAWSPHETVPSDPTILGRHGDYVRCLALCRERNWVASGSFDRTIKLWDISRPTSTTSNDALVTLVPPEDASGAAASSNPKGSIYALAADYFGRMVACGSPERVVRLWDPRSGKRIAKLVGHTDNIRAMVLSDDSRYLLTGSADASIKLWSLTSQRCLHTFTHHADSVWSLKSTHPELKVFYSGDRLGNLCRVDLTCRNDGGKKLQVDDVGEGECVVLLGHDGPHDGKQVKGTTTGINNIVVLDDRLVWSAMGQSEEVKRWWVPPRRSERPHTRLVPSGTRGFDRRMSVQSFVSSASAADDAGEINADRDVDGDKDGIGYDHLVRLESPNTYLGMGLGGRGTSVGLGNAEVATLYSAASFVSLSRMQRVPFPARGHSHSTSVSVNATPNPNQTAKAEAYGRYLSRTLAIDARPICSKEESVIRGDKGLVRSIVLNDRLTVLGANSLGDVGVWDLGRCQWKGVILAEDISRAVHGHNYGHGGGDGTTGCADGLISLSPRESLELVRERIEGEASVNPWCTTETKGGVLTVRFLGGDRGWEAEVWGDEVGIHVGEDEEDLKVNIAKWVLRNLFVGWRNAEERYRKRGEEDLTANHVRVTPGGSTLVVSSPTLIRAVRPVEAKKAESSPLLAPLIPIAVAKAAIRGGPPGLHVRTKSTQGEEVDYFSTPLSGTAATTPSNPLSSVPPSTPTGLMSRLKSFGKLGGKKGPDTPTGGVTAGSEGKVVNVPETIIEIQKTPVQRLLEDTKKWEDERSQVWSDAPIHSSFPGQTTVILETEGNNGSGWTTIFRGSVGGSQSEAGGGAWTKEEMENFEDVLPLWLAECLLCGNVPSAPSSTASPAQAKVSFVLVPWKDGADGGQGDLPELLNTAQSKLTANRYLRIKKVIAHVREKLEQIQVAATEKSQTDLTTPTTAVFAHPHPHSFDDHYEILCNDVVLPVHMTLAAVRQYVWKSGNEMVLCYRRKKVDFTKTTQGTAGDVTPRHSVVGAGYGISRMRRV